MQMPRHSSLLPAHTWRRSFHFRMKFSFMPRSQTLDYSLTAGLHPSTTFWKGSMPATIGCLGRRPSTRICNFPGHWYHMMQKERLDETWKAIGELNDENGTVLLKFLPSFMLSVLTIPHSSAHCERVFSCVRKNRTDQRASLGKATLDALLAVKSDVSPVWKRTFSDELLRRLKSCYAQSLKQQDSSSN